MSVVHFVRGPSDQQVVDIDTHDFDIAVNIFDLQTRVICALLEIQLSQHRGLQLAPQLAGLFKPYSDFLNNR